MESTARIATSSGLFLVNIQPYVVHIKDALKKIDGRRWIKEARSWAYPATPASAGTLYTVLHGCGLEVHGDRDFVDNLTAIRTARKLLLGKIEPTEPDFQTDKPRLLHQKIDYSLIKTLPGVYVAAEMGCMKTRIAIDAACGLGMSRVLIVCPRSVIPEWARQFKEHGDGSIVCVPLYKSSWSVKRRTKEAEEALEKHARVALVTNYEAVWRYPFGAEVEKKRNNQRIITQLGFALSTKWDMVVADEIHRIKESRTNVGWFFKHLRGAAKRRVGLSGTPIPNTPMDLWAQMLFIDPGVFGEHFVSFRSRYAVMGGFKNKQVLNFRNLEHMNKRFYTVSHRVTKDQALDLPPEVDEERTVELGKEAKRIYRDLEESFIARVNDGEVSVPNALTELLRLQQLTGGYTKLDTGEGVVVDEGKAKVLKEVLRDLPANEPVVIFARFHHDLEATAKVVEEIGRGYAELSRRRGRPKAGLEDWQEAGDELTVIGIQVQSGGEGINCSRASYAVWVSLGFSPGQYDQACSRVHRQGQKRRVTYIHLITRDCSVTGKTIDERVYASLKRKRKINRQALAEPQGEGKMVRAIMEDFSRKKS